MTTRFAPALDRAGLHNARIQRYGAAANNEVLIDLAVQETSEQALDQGKNQIINALETNAPAGKQDLNNTSSLTLANYLLEKDPLHAGTDANAAIHRPGPGDRRLSRQDQRRRAEFLRRTEEGGRILPWWLPAGWVLPLGLRCP